MADGGGAGAVGGGDESLAELVQRLEDAERRAHQYETVLFGIRGAIDAAIPPGDTVVRPEDG